MRERLGLTGKWVVGYAGSFRPWHGLDDLVSCAAHLSREEVVFLLVGDGPERPNLEQRIATLGLKDRFHLTGRVPYDMVPEYLAAADICVAPFRPDRHGPSRKHGMVFDPLKVFEYLALKKAVITIHSRNMERLFKDGEELLMVEPGDVAALASAGRDLCCDSGKAERLAVAGHAAVLERYTWQSHVEALEGIFRELLGRSQ